MHKTHYKLLVCLMIFLCLIVIPTSFAADADAYSIDDSVFYDNSLDSVDSLDSINCEDKSINLAESVDEEDSLASVDVEDINLESSESYDVLHASNVYYFNSSAAKDGNGTYANPYKYLYDSRIKNNSEIHLANGVYNLDNVIKKTNVIISGQNAAQTIINGSSKGFEVKGNFILRDLTLNCVEINNAGNFNATNVIFCNGKGIEDYYKNSYGGAIYSIKENYSIYLNKCSFFNNSATYGGAIYSHDSNIEIINCEFINRLSRYI